eukprot:gene30122-37285_t
MFGFTAELGNILLDAITFDPPNDLSDSSLYYGQVATSILNVFPEIAAQITPSTALKASATMAMESIKMVIKAFPAGAWTTDRTGALPLHWITHNQYCNSEMINYLINANPKGPWVADCDGYLPLHWAVNQDTPNIDVVAALIAANASASAKACMKGSLPLHWCVNRDAPNMQVMRALLQVHADGVRTFDKTGWLPLHQCVNRSDISIDALSLLIELYPQGLQCPNVNGQLPIHRSLDQLNPSIDGLHTMLEAFPGGSKVADDEGYLPIHLALDCARPNPVIAKMLLEHYPEAAFHKSKDGLLPIHCIISSMNPVVEIIQYLLVIFPDSTESMAVDVIPVDESADPETWTGEWIEKRWTPLSRAIDRGLDAIVVLFRDALNTSKNYVAPAGGNNAGQRGTGPLMLNTATPKTLLPQNKPPINNTSNMIMQPSPNGGPNQGPGTPYAGGPSTSSVENNRQLMPGGHDDQFDDGQFESPAPQQQLFSQTRNLPMSVNPNRGGMLNPDGSIGGGGGPMLSRPMSQPNGLSMQPGGPPPGGYTNVPLQNRGPVARGDKYSEAKDRQRDRQSSRERGNDGRDREHRSDRDRERRHRSSSRNHRSSGDRGSSRDRYYDQDDDRKDRDRHRSSRDRDRRESRDGSRNHSEGGGHRSQPPGRMYEQTEYDDIQDVGGEQDQQYYAADQKTQGQGQAPQRPSSHGGTPLSVGHIPPPSTQPPQSLVDAAMPRPYSRRGPNDQGPPTQGSNSGGSQQHTPSYQQTNGNQRDRGNSSTFNRDGSSELGEYFDTAAVDVHDYNQVKTRPISIDDLV